MRSIALAAIFAAAIIAPAQAEDAMIAYTSVQQDLDDGAAECAVETQTTIGGGSQYEYRSQTLGAIGLRGTIVELTDSVRLGYVGEYRSCLGGSGGDSDGSTMIGLEVKWTLIE
ncbi:hypothetical protein [Halofilum ochraceum]|uniref:hypothetical protein n=1 Tax=Halofilum ochraceum TaxID=1611323 RepID=UPI0008D9FD56|nr:hypothetical protein [Halofilum ochraceum]